MKVTVKSLQQPVNAVVELPGSKSITNRAILMAAMAQGNSTLSNVLMSDDSMVFINALKSLNIDFSLNHDDKLLSIQGKATFNIDGEANIWCQDAGTASRFLTVASAAFPGKYHFDGSHRLRERPLNELLQMLKQQGVKVLPDDALGLPCQIISDQGLSGGKIDFQKIPSSQFISAVLIAAPYAKSDVYLSKKNLSRRSYVDITIKMMRSFGVVVEETADDLIVKCGQVYQGHDYFIEPDLSTASYFFATAALTQGEITVKHIAKDNCLQGDIRFLEVLAEMGCDIKASENAVTLNSTSQLRGIEVNMHEFSDTFMTLACLAPFASTPVTITGIAHTRLQESDRVTAIATELTKLGAKVSSGEDYIKVYPGQLQGALVEAHNDHRVAMSLGLIGLKIPGVQINGAECVAKTCPDYFERLNLLTAV